jgi:peroxiredoxin Q/BCP
MRNVCMRTVSKTLGLLLFSAALLVAPARLQAGGHPAVGSAAPDFILPSQDGSPVSLSDYRGKWVVLYFYPKDFTPGCTLEAHNFQRDLPQYEKRNAVILGVSVDSADSHRQFCVEQGLNFKLLSDSEHTVSKAYGTLTWVIFTHASRQTFLIDPHGTIVQVFPDVSPPGHSAEVLAALDQLQKEHK